MIPQCILDQAIRNTTEPLEWEDSCSDKEGKAIKSLHVSLINSGIAGLAVTKIWLVLDPVPKRWTVKKEK